MFKKAVLLLSIVLCAFKMEAAQYTVYLTISDSTIISSVTLGGKPIFIISGINTIVNLYTVTGFQKNTLLHDSCNNDRSTH